MKCTCVAIFLALLSALSAVAQTQGPSVLRLQADVPVPPYCSPCLFYSGDFDPNGPKDNTLDNGITPANDVGAATIYIPFVIPAGQAWTVEGLFINEMVTDAVLDPPAALWSISSGISAGQAGTVVASGRGAATLTPTGRDWSGLTEYTVQVQVREFQLQPGKYWLSVLPLCTNVDNPACVLTQYEASDVEDQPPMNSKGISPLGESFYTNARGADYYRPTSGSGGVCNVGCDRFSAGAIGVARRTSR
jgi:hypothetical protein